MEFINAIDLYAILGNALDNAIEAVQKFKDPGKRQIDVVICRQQNFLVMNFMNPVQEAPVFVDDFPVTTKGDQRYHGFGLRSIRHFVRKYDGYLNISVEDGCFSLKIMMPIPMVADCSDYETYRSGKYIPGVMGTLFSLVDKLVSSLSATVVGIAVSVIGLQNLPTADTAYAPGMNKVVIVLFCIIPMIAWAATLICMRGYELTGPRMKEIQAVNAARKEGIANGMTLEEAMEKWKAE